MNERLILDRYRLVERVAVGGSAEVWRAHDVQLDRSVAVKRLHPHLVPDESSRKRLAAEARAAAGLSHPGIVDIYDVDASDPPALVMELVDGESLSARIAREGPLPPREAASIGADIADALFHAHQRGVVHRDVKPGNVLIATDGRTRLVDFGISHSLALSAERLTMTGTVVGTMSAMAPEQLAGGAITPRTDLYGIGVVLHEALTGRPPYPGGSPLALAEAQRAGPPPMDGVDPALAAIVSACLALEPENRPLHAGALALALRAWLAGDRVPALAMAPTGTHQPAIDTGATTQIVGAAPMPAMARADAGGSAEASPYRGRPHRGLLLGVAALLGTAVVAVALSSMVRPAVAEPSSSATPAVSPSDPSTPAPTQVALPGWADKLAEDYAEECGTELDPALISGMNKRQAQQAIEPQIEACREAGD